jgi:methyl-accepting chemotaxis protein
MRFTSRWSIRTKLFATLGLVFLVLGVPVGAALLGVNAMASSFTAYTDREVPLVLALTEMYAQGLQSGQATRNVMLNPADKTAAKNYAAALDDFAAAHKTAVRLAEGRPALRTRL